MDNWLLNHLVCPRDKSSLELREGNLRCSNDHTYPVVNGCPIMLVDEAESTHGYIEATKKKVTEILEGGEQPEFGKLAAENGGVDDFVQKEIVYTSGNLYSPVEGNVTRYPIPEFRPPESDGGRLLDIGCNWGRWSVAAGRKGYRPVGLDPSLDAVMAAGRISKQLGIEANFVVGDARFLPFSEDAFDVVFSYGVFQHFSKENTLKSLEQISRVLKEGHKTFVQMPNRFGVRQYYQHWKRGFTEGEGFEIRYWTPTELLDTFRSKFGETEISSDCYFGLGIQKSDVDLLPLKYKAVVYSSEILKTVSTFIPPLVNMADSVYLVSVNQKKALSRT